eukprot:GILK01003512.1.p1 GENE.GILK01003512.1~~GILK01003512.1.p1  ORF type:complete len:284 (-),score=25.96 GILK01003512.1:122-973(-)
MPVVDAWCQPGHDKMLILPEVERLFRQSGSRKVLEQGLTFDEVLADMYAANITTAMMCAWARPGKWLLTNDQVCAIKKRFPVGMVEGVATVDLEDPVQAVAELTRAVTQLGCKALRIVPWLWKRPPTDPLYYPLFVRCVELDIPFCTQVGHTGPLMPSETGRPVPYIDQIALTFPQLKIVCGHIGHPWTDEMIGVAWKHENVFIDTSAYLPRYYPPALLQYMQTYGKDKVLFGTNFPQLGFERCVRQAHELQLPPDVQDNFLWRNAARVFKLDMQRFLPRAKL